MMSEGENRSNSPLLRDDVAASPLTEDEARSYANELTLDNTKRQVCGCYLVRCVCCYNLPIACSFNYEPCVGCLHTVGTLPFSCFVCLCRWSAGNVWTNIKGDTHLMSSTPDGSSRMSCYWAQKSQPLCTCDKMC